MAKRKKIINPGGINGSGKGIVNTNSADYKKLQKAIQNHSKKQNPKDKIRYQFISLKLQIESYIGVEHPEIILTSGYFLKKYLEVINIKNKDFAKFIDINPTNLSAILKGRRKMNTEIAFKVGQIFNINPNLWLLIQSKNDLLGLDEKRTATYQKYKLDDLLKKVG